jgi:chromosomal replication initiation ATPase DnaA
MNMTSADRSDPLRQSACARLAEVAVAATAHLPAEILRTPGRGHPRAALARQTAMYLAHVAFGLTLSRVGICFGRDRTTVRHACARIEDRRDDPTQELALSAIEAGLLALTTALGAIPKEEVHP